MTTASPTASRLSRIVKDKENNKTEELKRLLDRVTSLSTVETDLLRNMVEFSRTLKIE
jgi:hypothetical protein